MRPVASWVSLGALSLAACSEVPEPARVEHRAVVAEAIAALEAGLPAEPAAPAVDPEHVAGLVQFLSAAHGRERELPLLEIAELGDGATPWLAGIVAARERDAAERTAAIELLGALGTRGAAQALLDQLESSPDAWVRAHCAWRLGDAGQDVAVPRLVKRLLYEKDPETIVWIARSLGAFRNDAGLPGLWALRNAPPSPEVGAQADAALVALAEQAGAADAVQHWELHANGDPDRRLLRAEPSRALELEAWRQVSMLSGAHFQLRGVDDARHVLSNMGAWVVPILAAALRDEDVYVRVHAAQCLERMGPRAFDAGPLLLAALDDPSLASGAATALGAIGYPTAEPRLRALLATGTPHDLRVAAVQALATLSLPTSVPALSALLAPEEPLDLRQAAALALVGLGRGREVAPQLVEWMQDPAADRHAAEAAFQRWLESRDDEAASELLEAWRALGAPPGIIPTAAQDDERLTARAALARGVLERR